MGTSRPTPDECPTPLPFADFADAADLATSVRLRPWCVALPHTALHILTDIRAIQGHSATLAAAGHGGSGLRQLYSHYEVNCHSTVS